MGKQRSLLVVDYPNLDFSAKRHSGIVKDFVDLRALHIAANEVSGTFIQDRIIFVSDVYWAGLFDFKRGYIEKSLMQFGYQLIVVPVPLGLENRKKRMQKKHLFKYRDHKAWEDPVDLAMIEYCKARKRAVRTLVVASSDGGFTDLVRKFGGFVVYYNTPSLKLLKAARSSLQANPGRAQ